MVNIRRRCGNGTHSPSRGTAGLRQSRRGTVGENRSPPRDRRRRPSSSRSFLNRELSRLDFIRARAGARRRRLPARCSSASSSSRSSAGILDEFFQIRVSGLQGAGGGRPAGDVAGRAEPARAARRDPRARAGAVRRRRARHLRDHAREARLARAASASSTGTSSRRRSATSCSEMFENRIFPVLTPLAVDPAHPFPYISDLSLNLAVVVARPAHARAAASRA